MEGLRSRAPRQRFCLAPLTPDLASSVLLLLPVDERMRCRGVSRAWRALLSSPSLWTCVDLSFSSGVTARRTDRLLEAASALARGGVQELRLVIVTPDQPPLGDEHAYTEAGIRAVVAANGASLRVLDCDLNFINGVYSGLEFVRALVDAAPRLPFLKTNAQVTCSDALLLLRKEPPFQGVQLDGISVLPDETSPSDGPALVAALLQNGHLKHLDLRAFEIGASLDAVSTCSFFTACAAHETDAYLQLMRPKQRTCRACTSPSSPACCLASSASFGWARCGDWRLSERPTMCCWTPTTRVPPSLCSPSKTAD